MVRVEREDPDRFIPSKDELLCTLVKQNLWQNVVYRMCRTPDCKRVVGAWMLYEDVNQTFDTSKGWDIPVGPSPAACAIRNVSGKGRGLIATRAIRCGDVVLRERPIIIAPNGLPGTVRSTHALLERSLLQLIYWLEPADRERVLQLHNSKSIFKQGLLNGILRTNAMRAEFPDSAVCSTYDCIGLQASMANHSCSPNCDYRVLIKDPVMEVYALRDIQKGEEITISYVDIYLPSSERKDCTMENFAFICKCKCCSGPLARIKESDTRRKFLKGSTRTLNQDQEFIKHLKSLLDAMDKEKVDSDRGRIAVKLASLYAYLGDEKNFQVWCTETPRTLMGDAEQLASLRLMWTSWQRQPMTMPGWSIKR